jgi:uncharacterized membrane protein YdbT with pleckstrin-like domain
MMQLDKLPNAKPGEKTILFLRRHWFVPAGILLLLIALMAVPVGVYYIIYTQASWLFDHQVARPLLLLLASFYYYAIWVYSFSEFIDYYLDVWLVTNERIINIEQMGLFSRVASELNLTAVQDVTSNVHGFVNTIFDYGLVEVQTAGESGRFEFKQVEHPEIIKRQIIQMADQARAKQRQLAADAVSRKLKGKIPKK